MEKVSLKQRGVRHCHRHYSANTVAFTFVTVVDNVQNIFDAFQDGKRNNYSKKKKDGKRNGNINKKRRNSKCRGTNEETKATLQAEMVQLLLFLMNLTEYVACFLLMDVKELKVQ